MTLTRLSQNTLLLLVSNVGGAILLFALAALIGRASGSAGLGVYAVALAWVYPLSLLVEFGLTTLMIREVSADLSLVPAYMVTITRLRLWMGGGGMIVLYLTAPLLSRDPAVIVGLQVSAPLLIIQPIYSQFTTVFKAYGAMWTIPILNMGMIGAQVILTAFVLANGGTVIHALILNTLTSAGQLIAAWAGYRQMVRVNETLSPTLPRTQEGKQLKVGRGAGIIGLLKSALPFALAALFSAVQTRVLLIFLESSVSEAGYFSAANRFAEAARLVPNALFGALFPSLAALAAAPVVMRRTFRRAAFGLTVFGIITGVGFTISAPILLTLVFGEAFNPAAPALILLGWSVLFTALRGARTIYWYAQGREAFVNWVNGAVVIVIIGLSLVLIPYWGANGAALALLVTEIAATAALYERRAA